MSETSIKERGRELFWEAERIYLTEGGAALSRWEAQLSENDRAALDIHWQGFVEALRAMSRALAG